MWAMIRAFLPIFRQRWALTLIYGALVVLSIAVSIGQPYFYKLAIDGLVSLTGQAPFTSEWSIGQVIFGWFLCSYGSTVFSSLKGWFFWDWFANPITKTRLVAIYDQLLKLDIREFINRKSGSITKTFDESSDGFADVNNLFIDEILTPLLSGFGMLFLGFYYSPPLTLVVLGVIPIQIAVSYFGYRYSQPIAEKARVSWSALQGKVADVIGNILITKSFQKEADEIKAADELYYQGMKQQSRTNRAWAMQDFFDIELFSTFVLVAFGYYLIQAGSISIGTLLMFMTIRNRLLVPVLMVKNNLKHIQKNVLRYQEMEKIISSPKQLPMAKEPHIQTSSSGQITFDHVSFTYNEHRDALKDISLIIKPGEKIALVGHSGAGKSTIAMLLMRFYDVTSGSISLDGIDIRQWEYNNFRSHFSVVWQENLLFHDTIAANIAYSKQNATEQEIKEAAVLAHADSFIKGLKNGYQSIVGERGVRLSGGEKQRVAIARALLKNPSIVILDEATSALDSITEQEVQKGIMNLISSRTAIIIAHRLSTIRNCDRIVMLEQGQIIAVGTHQELLKTCPSYQEMVTLQSESFIGCFD
ncbi:ABC transporter ATP-binding protein [Candidatus Gracilibacteria bacterium]|nr:ABC transporter ATP-binding protein [Candidatus Gracilibacteria bacterium]